jgi:hypothetical protein
MDSAEGLESQHYLEHHLASEYVTELHKFAARATAPALDEMIAALQHKATEPPAAAAPAAVNVTAATASANATANASANTGTGDGADAGLSGIEAEAKGTVAPTPAAAPATAIAVEAGVASVCVSMRAIAKRVQNGETILFDDSRGAHKRRTNNSTITRSNASIRTNTSTSSSTNSRAAVNSRVAVRAPSGNVKSTKGPRRGARNRSET